MRGISPIVAVVLLVAIAVVGSVSISFFVGGMATKEQGTDQATSTATAATVVDSQNGLVMVQNLGTDTISAQTLEVAGVDTAGCVLANPIPPGEQEMCHMTGFEGEATIYGSGIGSAVVKAGAGDTNPYFIAFMKPTNGYSSADAEGNATAVYSWLVNQGYNVTNVTRSTTDFSDFDVIVIGPDASASYVS